MLDSTLIYLIFFSGQAKANIDMTFQGQTPGELTELGINQAKELAQKYKERNIIFDKIICSDLHRAKQTYEQIKHTQPTNNVEFTDLVREIHNKYYEGKKIPLFLEEIKVNKRKKKYIMYIV